MVSRSQEKKYQQNICSGKKYLPKQKQI